MLKGEWSPDRHAGSNVTLMHQLHFIGIRRSGKGFVGTFEWYKHIPFAQFANRGDVGRSKGNTGMNLRRILLMTVSATSFATIAAPTLAQTAPAAVEEVIVTAQRRAENLQSVPVTVSAFTSNQLEQRQITSTVDLVRTIPNLVGHNNTGTGSANTYFLRGLGSTEQIATLDPAVSTNVDDVIIPRQNVNNYALFDVERIEVLRGPQGTTFGRNSTGGAINVITRKPGTEFGGFVSGAFGSFDKRQVRGSVDAPISDKILTKFSAFYDKDDGWLKNITNGERFNGAKNLGLRAAVRYLPSTDVTWDVSLEHLTSDGLYLRSILGQPRNTRTQVAQAGESESVLLDALANRGQRNKTKSSSLSSNLEWKVGELTVNAITGIRSVDQEFVIDFSLPTATTNPLPFVLTNDGQYNVFTQEFKVSGESGSLRYVGGVFFFREENTTLTSQILPIPGINPISCSRGFTGDGQFNCNGAPGYSSSRHIDNDTTSWAAYGQVDYQFTDQFSLQAGARYTIEEKTVDLQPTPQGGMTTANLRTAGIDTKLNTNILTPRVALNFKPNDATLIYVSATRGFKAGGWNSRTAYRPQEFRSMTPETTWSYEAGLKTELFERRLRVNATAFYAETDNLQLSYTTPGPTPGSTLSTQDNAGDIEVKGVELEVVARPIANLELFGTAGFQEGKYTRVNPRANSFCPAGTVNLTLPSGCTAGPFINAIDAADELSRFPKRTVAVGGVWTIPIEGLGGSFKISGEANYNGGYWTTASNAGPSTRTPTALNSYSGKYTLLNGSISFVSDDQMWKATLDCKNCSDKTYITSIFNGAFYGEPRKYTFSVQRKF